MKLLFIGLWVLETNLNKADLFLEGYGAEYSLGLN